MQKVTWAWPKGEAADTEDQKWPGQPDLDLEGKK